MKSTEYLRLYAVTDRSWVTADNALLEQVKHALAGGITCLQLREKDRDKADFLAEAQEIHALCRAQNVPFFINDDWELALACDADGVHVGQSDANARFVRQQIGKDKLLGVSAQTVAQAIQAEQDGADYLGVGAVFPTSTKTDAAAVSLDTLRAICQAVSIPVIAIGGIATENLDQLQGTGIGGVAVVSAIFGQKDIQNACCVLNQKTKALSTRSIQGIIFDMDGTLLDSMSMWAGIGEAYLIARGITPLAGTNETFKNLSLVDSALYYQEVYGITDDLETIMADVNRMVEGFYFHEAKTKAGVMETLEELEADGVRMCIATATDRYLVEAVLERLGLRRFFSEIFTCTDVGAGKNDPLIFETALQHLGTEKDKTPVFEDSLHAIETAHKAGFPILGIYDNAAAHQQNELKALSTCYLHDFSDWRTYYHEKCLEHCRF